MPEYIIIGSLFEGLVNIANDGETILPGVAERWEISSDGRTYTFHLREDARWSDGQPVTADDFVYSFRRTLDPQIGCPNNFYGFYFVGGRDYATGKTNSPDAVGLKAIDPRTLELKLEQPTPYIIYLLGQAPLVPLPRVVLERFGAGSRPNTDWSKPGNLVSNGPFMLKSWKANADLVVIRNPHYWDRNRVRLQEVRFYPTDNVDTEELMFRAGELHITAQVPLTKIATYRQGPAAATLHIAPTYETGYLVFNTTRPPFNDSRVRRAFSLVIDRDRVIPLVLHERGMPAHSLTRPGTDKFTPARVQDYNPPEARRLLAEAGFPGGKGFPIIECTEPNYFQPALLEALQQIWQRELGVNVPLTRMEGKVFLDDLLSHHFSVALTTYSYIVNAPEMVLLVGLRATPYNYGGWQHGEFEAAFAAAHTDHEEDRRRAWARMEALVHTEAPYAPLYFNNVSILVHPSVRGWRDNGLYAIDWRELWLEEAKH